MTSLPPRVAVGDSIKAAHHNQVLSYLQSRGLSTFGKAKSKNVIRREPAEMVWGVNSSGQNIKAYEVLAYKGLPFTDVDLIITDRLLDLELPSGDYDEHFFVAAQALDADQVGLFYASGISLAVIRRTAADAARSSANRWTYANTYASEQYLLAGHMGTGKILWEDTSGTLTDSHLALGRWGEGQFWNCRPFRVVSCDDEYLTCHVYDWTTEGATSIYVAKPPALRKSQYNGITRNSITYTYVSAQQRTASDGTNSQTEVIVPSYQDDDVIFAMRADTGVFDSGGAPVVWQDINDWGRAWAEQAT